MAAQQPVVHVLHRGCFSSVFLTATPAAAADGAGADDQRLCAKATAAAADRCGCCSSNNGGGNNDDACGHDPHHHHGACAAVAAAAAANAKVVKAYHHHKGGGGLGGAGGGAGGAGGGGPLQARHLLNISREVGILTRLRELRVPGVVALCGASCDAASGAVYLVFEPCLGGDLYRRLLRGGPLAEAALARDVVGPLLRVLARLHALGIVHRDVKPENVFFDAKGGLVLGDFGLAIDAARERPTSRVGTLDYMAPEVLAQPSADVVALRRLRPATLPSYGAAVDVWAVGVLVHEAISGRTPFAAADAQTAALKAQYRPPPPLPPGSSAAAQAFVDLALQKAPERRPGALELLAHPWLASHGAGGPGSPTARRQPLAAPLPPAPAPPLPSSLPSQQGGGDDVGAGGGGGVNAAGPRSRGEGGAAAAAGALRQHCDQTRAPTLTLATARWAAVPAAVPPGALPASQRATPFGSLQQQQQHPWGLQWEKRPCVGGPAQPLAQLPAFKAAAAAATAFASSPALSSLCAAAPSAAAAAAAIITAHGPAAPAASGNGLPAAPGAAQQQEGDHADDDGGCSPPPLRLASALPAACLLSHSRSALPLSGAVGASLSGGGSDCHAGPSPPCAARGLSGTVPRLRVLPPVDTGAGGGGAADAANDDDVAMRAGCRGGAAACAPAGNAACEAATAAVAAAVEAEPRGPPPPPCTQRGGRRAALGACSPPVAACTAAPLCPALPITPPAPAAAARGTAAALHHLARYPSAPDPGLLLGDGLALAVGPALPPPPLAMMAHNSSGDATSPRLQQHAAAAAARDPPPPSSPPPRSKDDDEVAPPPPSSPPPPPQLKALAQPPLEPPCCKSNGADDDDDDGDTRGGVAVQPPGALCGLWGKLSAALSRSGSGRELRSSSSSSGAGSAARRAAALGKAASA